jgi:hypothetical protein
MSSDPVGARLGALEAVVFAGCGGSTPAQVVSTSPATIAVRNGALILLTCPGGAVLTLPSPTSVQSGFTIVLFSANAAVNTVSGSFTSTGSPGVSFTSLTDSGGIGNVAKLVAVNGAWQLTSGVGWAGVGGGGT